MVTVPNQLHELTTAEAHELFDREARRLLGVSGPEFIQAWEAGQFDAEPERPEVTYLAMLLPLAK